MSGSEQEDKGAKPPRAGSSLTDAVAAALATVDGGDGAETKSDEGKSVEPPVVGSAPPPRVSGAPAPAMAAPANGPTVTNGTNGTGFRAGPGSFSDLLRRWESGQTAPAVSTPPEAAKADEDSASDPEADEGSAASADSAEADSADADSAADSESGKSQPPESAAEGAEPKSAPSEAREPIEITYYGCTDVGLIREHNEDNFTVADLGAKLRDSKAPRSALLSDRGLILAVCDGMGGAAAGEVASQMAVDTIYETMCEADPADDRDEFARRVVHAIEEAGHRIFSAAKMDRTRRGMGTTSTLAGLVDNVMFVGQVGDSRAYVLRGEQFVQVTKDQSLVNQLIEAGQLTEDEAEAFEHSNIILQALGTTEDVTVDLTFLEMRKGDRLLMCSDGLSGLVHAEMMKEVLQETQDLPEAAQKLIQMANAGGGHDNITVILADFAGEGLAPPAKTKVAYQQYPLPPDESASRRSGPPRETSIKPGGAKPGADVKRGDDYAAPIELPTAGGGSRAMVIGAVVLLALLVGVAVLYFGGFLGGGSTETPDDPPPIPSDVEPDPMPDPEPLPDPEPIEEPVVEPEAVQGTITLQTEIEDATLFVNGEDRGALTDGQELSLEPGTYRLEAREGENVIDQEDVTLEADGAVQVTLEIPAGAEPPPERPRPRPRPPRDPRPRPNPRPLGGGAGTPTPRPLGGGTTPTPSGGGTPDNPF
ncbi:MAG: Stp1/IreP family PP2C-type Ser/Thr phosphatase [Sandaracinaceae bacterium]